MHPLDSSLDASLHANSNNNNNTNTARVKRRSSLDNGCFATNESIFLLTMSAVEYYASNDIQMKSISRRRLSLNNCMTMPTTFLSTYNSATSGTTKKTSELDADCHNYLDDIELKNISRHSLTCSTHTQNQRRYTSSSLDCSKNSIHKKMNNNTRTTGWSSMGTDDDDSSSFGSDCDSFCEAAVQEEANKCFIEQMGVSCMFKDDALFLAVDADEELENRTSESGKRWEDDNITDDNDCMHATILRDHDAHDISDKNDTDDESFGDDDSNDDCDSFCDATEKEPANAQYLRKDLGASCFWASNDLEDALCNLEWKEEQDDGETTLRTFTTTGTPHTMFVGIGTITEEA